MRRFAIPVLCMLAGQMAHAEPAARFQLSEPAAEKLLQETRKIKPQTGPAYFVNGSFKCTETSWEIPPYKAVASCTIWVDGVKLLIPKAEPILNSLQDFKPMTGPYYSVQGRFSARSISREFPPYDVAESAEVTLAD